MCTTRLRAAAIESALAVLLLAPLLDPGAARANLLINGSFENGGAIEFTEGWYAILDAGSTELPGWVVTRATIDYVTDTGNPLGDDLCQQVRCVDLDGTPGFGGIAQSFATVPGQSYGLSFALSGNPGEFSPSEPHLKLLRVLVAGTSTDLSFDTSGHTSPSAVEWIPQAWTFTAVGTTTSLEFQSLDTAEAGYSGYFGPMIDDVAVDVIPEPSTAWLLLTGLLIGGGARHTRRSSVALRR